MPSTFNAKKFINAALFFAERDTIGITKLNKLLYFSDFEHFRLYGRPIIGDEYIKMERGPVPERAYSIFNSNFRDKQDDSLSGYFEVKPRRILDFTEKTILPMRKADVSCFSQSELDVMGRVSEQYKGKTAAALSGKSHEESPWKKTDLFQKIDYRLILDDADGLSVSKEYVDHRDEQAEELADILGR
ncbi:MAG: SocA family protein [Patescibacteria group bacterium]|nr:SocA family protein [Patescibacteria group bacterium]